MLSLGKGEAGLSLRQPAWPRQAPRDEAAQHRLDTRRQLTEVKSFCGVVVGADLQADHVVDDIPAAGHDHQPAAPVLAQLTQ
jgi:hypothetical protein